MDRNIIPWEDIKYKNVKKIGEGVFSVVYKADNNVVIKMQKYGKSNKEVFIDELNIYSKLLKSKHYNPCVIKPIENFKTLYNDSVRICIVFERMTCDLLKFKKISKKSRLPIDKFKIIMKQILEGLDFLHKNEIIHTDIKPENILINSDLNVKIIDLGNACYFDKHFSNSISTSEYRSPEAILYTDYNEKADIWSTACLFYELFTGNYLFDSWDCLEPDFESETEEPEETEEEIEPEESEETEEKIEPEEPEEPKETEEEIEPSDSDSDSDSDYDSETDEDSDSEDESEDNDIQHLHLMETLLGKFPKRLIKGDNAMLYFDKNGNLKEPDYKLGNSKISELLECEYGYNKESSINIEEFLLPMLKYDPKERASAEQMLEHKFLKK